MGDFSSPLLCSPLSVSHSLKLTKQMETQDERKSQAYGNDLRQDDFNENIWEDEFEQLSLQFEQLSL